jgi:flavodoxin
MLNMKFLDRRAFVRRLLVSLPIAAATLRGHSETTAAAIPSTQTGSATPGASESSVLLVYFSRAGENYYHGDRIDLEVGNTKVVADMISDRIGCDVYEILAAEPYPEDYEETRERNVQEQDTDARPEIANPLPSIDEYDLVILGSPIWSSRPPMIMSTFAESFDFAGKMVLPLVTYAVSGMGNAERVYQEACRGATFDEGLAVQGEQVIDAPDDAASAVETWLRRVGLVTAAATPKNG